MSLTYTQYFSATALLCVVPETDPNFIAIFPNAIDYAEQRIYRELDMLQNTARDTAALAPNNRNFTLPSANGIFVTVNGINVVTPAGTLPDNGTRTPLIPVSRDFLDFAWPSVTGATLPFYFAMLTQGSILVGPWPDAAYVLEVVGTKRPAPISASNASTFLSTNLPDLLIAATMIFLAGYQKNFGAQADDPKMAASWSGQYDTLFASANTEENRKKFWGSAWSAMSPSTVAQPARN